MFKLTEWTLTLAYASDNLRTHGDVQAAKNLDDLLDWLLIHLDHLDEVDAKLPTVDTAKFIEKVRQMKKRHRTPAPTAAELNAQRIDHMENPSTEPDSDAQGGA